MSEPSYTLSGGDIMKKIDLILLVNLICTALGGCAQLENVANEKPDALYVFTEEHTLPMYETYAMWEEKILTDQLINIPLRSGQ